MAKTVLPSKFTEWNGLDRINAVVHEMRCIFRKLSKDDYGIDGEIEVVVPKEGGVGFETKGGVLKVQAKSGMSYVKEDGELSFAAPVTIDDLNFWRKSLYPVLFIVYHPQDDKLYWKEIRSYVKATPNLFQPPHKVVFDKQCDEFSSSSYRSICNLASASLPRVTFEQKERLYSNLFLVRRLPRLVYVAPAIQSDEQIIRRELRDRNQSAPPFCVRAGTLYAFSDPRHPKSVLSRSCDSGATEEIKATDWWRQDSTNFIYLLKQLFGTHLRNCGLRYSREHKRNYFPRPGEGIVSKMSWFSVRTSRMAPARSVAKFYKYGADCFWRHLAMSFRFEQVGGVLYLQLQPRYHYTYDGTQPYNTEKVGALTTRIKAVERNQHVLNHVLFWADTLSRQRPAIEIKLFERTVMVIEKMPVSGIAPFAIHDDPAVYDEDEVETAQLDFSAALFPALRFDDEEEEDEY